MEKPKNPHYLLIALCFAQFFLPFMLAGVSSILIPIGITTKASAKELGLIATYYTLGLVIFQLVTGRMGDIWGRRRMFCIGIGIYTVTTFVIGFLDSILHMHVLRFVQGAGAGMYGTSAFAILALIAPEGKRGQYIGFVTAAAYAGLACGPTLSGLISSVLAWQYFFWSTAACAAMLWAYMLFMVKTEWFNGKGEPFNVQGALIYAVSIGTMTIGSTFLQEDSTVGFSLLFAGLCFLVLYVRMELRAKYPLLDIRLFAHNRVLTLSLLAALINYSAIFGMLIFFSLYLQLIHGMELATVGLYLSLQFVVQSFTTPMAGRLADTYGASRISAIGICLCGVGLCSAAFLGKGDSLPFFTATQIVLGLGMSLFAAPNTTVIFESAGQKYVGQAASLTGTIRNAGALINAAIISATFGYFLNDAPPSTENVDAFLQSMRFDLILFGLFNLAAIGCALSRGRNLKKTA